MDRITLDIWTKNHPSLGIAYELKESFFDLWDSDSRQKAYLKYHDWKAKSPTELQSAFEPLTKAMANWEEEIFSYFDHRVRNAYTESLNIKSEYPKRKTGKLESFPVRRADSYACCSSGLHYLVRLQASSAG
ncbi:transposase IS1001 [Paenibacillus mucilaginosus K02]|uniref:Transposase IS1001 n=1 Tax=Paenibacillus mucilaginosus K02 TaxID=997761 RepID=I0BGS2_9BACL|nr:transposase [Paenibacillus mucilaginosus]AFH61569.1 transposase IS1001 [Paenibacillus mucilaginosus K02]